MESKHLFYEHLLNKVSLGYAHHELVFNEQGSPSDYRFLDLNISFERIAGLSREEILGKTAKEIFPDIESCAFNWIAAFTKVALTGESIEIEQYFEPLSRWIKVEVISCNTNYFTAFYTDISVVKNKSLSEEAQLLKAREESDERLKHLTEGIPDMIFIMHRDGTILEIFSAIPEKLIAAENELVGTSIKDCFDNDEFNRHISIYEHCIATSKNDVIEFELFIKGQKMYFESFVKPIDNEKLLTIVRDKTDQKQLLERISDGFVAMDASMNYIIVNEAAGKLLGKMPRELIGKNYWTVFPDAKGTPFANAYLKALKTQETFYIEDYYEPWGRWFSNYIYPSPNGLSIIFQEITEKKLSEEALKESERQSAFLADTAVEMAGMISLNEVYAYAASKLNQLLNGHSHIAVIEYSSKNDQWNIQHLEGLEEQLGEINRILGFDLRKLEGEISRKYRDVILSDKLVEIPFDFKGLFNNKFSVEDGKMVKDLLLVEKMYSMALKQSNHLFGTITFSTTKDTGKLNTQLIEAFILQVANFIKRLHAERELKLSEEKFGKAFHNSPAIIGLSDIEKGEYIEVNQTFIDLLEYSRGDIEGKKIKDLIKMEPSFREMALNMLREKGSVRNLETTIHSKSGRALDVLLSADILQIHDKAYNFTTGIDITELKKAEKQRLESESRFRAYVANAPLGVFIVDQNGNYLEVNEEACRLTGYNEKELLGKNIMDIISAESIETSKHHFNEVTLKGRATAEIIGYTKSGKKRWWNVVAAKISENRFIGFHEDISERKTLNQELVAAQANLTAIIENTFDSIWSVNKNYEITYLNEVFKNAFEGIFGVKLKIGDPILQFFPDEIQQMWKARYDRVLKGERVVFDDVVGANGEYVYIEVAANPIVQHGEVTGVSIFGKDVTMRKINEKELKQNEALIKSIFRSAPIGIGLLVNRIIQQANDLLCQMTGYSEEELLNKSIRLLYITEDEYISVGEQIYSQINKSDIGKIETKWKKKGGEIIEVLLSISPINQNELTQGVTFTAIDITAQKLAERSLVMSNQRLESFIEISRTITQVWDKDQIIQQIVDNAVGIMGMQAGAVYLKENDVSIKLAATSPPLPPDFPENLKSAMLSKHPHIAKAIITKRNVLLADTLTANLTSEEEDIVRLLNLRSNLYIPILLRDEALGVLILSSFEKMDNLKDEDISLLQGFANQAAHIMENVKHFEVLKNYTIELNQQILQRMKAESELRKLSQAVEQSPASVVITNLDGVIDYVNPKFTQITGYTMEEVIGKKPNVLKSGLQSAALYQDLWKTIEGGNEWKGELQNKKKNGELFWEAVSISPLFDNEGVKTHYIGIKEDITDRKKVEENLLEAHKISKLGTFELDLNSMVFTVSENMADIYGFENKNKFTFEEWLKSVHSDEREILNQLIKDAINKEDIELTVEFRIIRIKDNILKWIQAVGKLKYDESGKAVSLIGTSRDITEMKTYEQELIDAKVKAEESNRLKTAFLQNLSHEVRTPLNGIIGFSELINDDDITAEDRKKFAEIIMERGWQLTSIINDILAISALETGQEELYNEEFDINKFISNNIEVFNIQASTKGIQFYFSNYFSKEQLLVYGDKNKIGQILNNLFSNALKFTKEGSIEIGYNVIDGMMEFYVKDTGIGIDKEKHTLIFERFAQADDLIRRDFGGTGLGLSICKGYAELMNGKIWVDSEPGKGSTFHFSIPFIPVSKYHENETNNNEPIFFAKKPRILVAEDDENNYFVLELMLQQLNCDVLRASNGQEAIQLCKNHPVDLVLMDVKMPVLDGYTASLIIKEFNSEIPIIGQSAHASPSEVQHLKDAFDDYITKPFKKSQLRNCIKKYLKN